jgi:hypothetical protein
MHPENPVFVDVWPDHRSFKNRIENEPEENLVLHHADEAIIV